MAIIDASAVTSTPWVHVASGVGTNWQQVTLPSWCRAVSVTSSAALFIGFIGQDTPTDGGAVGTHKWAQAADAQVTYPIRPQDGYQRGNVPPDTATSIFVAAQSGTATVRIFITAA